MNAPDLRQSEYDTSVPLTVWPHVAADVLRGLYRRRRERNLPLHSALVREFFEDRSRRDSFRDITDANRPFYLRLIEGSSIVRQALTSAQNILDLGCGRAPLYAWLQHHTAAHYLGVDMDSIAIARCAGRLETWRRAQFICADITARSVDAIGRHDVIFAINLLPYIDDLDRLFTTIAEYRTPHGTLIIVDPEPSPYWEREFGGFTVKLRPLRERLEVCRRHNWNVTEIGRLAIMLVGTTFFTLSTLIASTAGE